MSIVDDIGVGASPAGPVLAGPLFFCNDLMIWALRVRLWQLDYFESPSYASGWYDGIAHKEFASTKQYIVQPNVKQLVAFPTVISSLKVQLQVNLYLGS